MNDFAKAQLMKYGWSEGKGLGKHESGITEAIKPKLKFDTAGIGHKDDDWNNWWENAFNKAVKSITVESQNHGVAISVSKGNEPDKLAKEALNEKKSRNSRHYGNFLKTSTLHDGHLIEESNVNLPAKQTVEQSIAHVPLTDEELFKICGGRTAHKGARHGLTLNGKLKRIAQQEQDLLRKNSCANPHTKIKSNSIQLESDECETINNENSSIKEIPAPKGSKHSRRKNKRRMNDLTHQLNVLCNISDVDGKNGQVITEEELKQEKDKKHGKRKRKKEKRGDSISYDMESVGKEEADNEPNDTSFPVSQKSEHILELLSGHNDKEFDNVYVGKKRKKKKKNKCRDDQYETIANECRDKDLCGSEAKKFKRSHKSDSDLQLLIKNEEINTLDDKFREVFLSNVASLESHKIRDSSVSAAESVTEETETYQMKEAHYLNARITRKKQSKLRKKQKIGLCKITNTLSAFHLNTEESTKGKVSKRKLKKVAEELMATDVTREKTLKKKKKSK